MKQKSTPDERFLIKLYQTAMAGGDPHAIIDYRGIAKTLGQKETAMKNIIKHLAQANFLKKVDDTSVTLTERGCDLVLEKWYRTGDLGTINSDRFLILSGRLKRFVKIGGEMISLGAIEEAIGKKLIESKRVPSDAAPVAICSDEKEAGRARLILFSIIEIEKEEANEILQQAGFSNLIKISLVKKIDAIPLMGAGKTDYRSLQSLC